MSIRLNFVIYTYSLVEFYFKNPFDLVKGIGEINFIAYSKFILEKKV